jgi:hypothetical protein
MTKILNTLFILICTLSYAHKNAIVERTYGNVHLISSTSFLTEETNKNLITGKYVELLSKEFEFTQTIHLYLIDDNREFKIYSYFENKDPKWKGLNVTIVNSDTHVAKTLNLIRNIFLNQKLIDTLKEDFPKWYESESSDIVKNILSIRIDRPNDIPELKLPGFFDYYYQNETYHILSFQNREVIEVAQFKNLLQFSIPTPSLLCIFTEIDSLIIITSDYKYNFKEEKYYPTSETINLKIEPKWTYSFRPYLIRQLGRNYITFESLYGEEVSLYNIPKKTLIKDLSTKIEE